VTQFALDPGLEGDSDPVASLELCQVRLMNDANYPWLLMIPAIPGLVEFIDLDAGDRARLTEEIARTSEVLRAATGCHKLNIAMLGNQVPQLHVHVIARFETDAAWPGPIWGAAPPVRYERDARVRLIAAIAEGLAD